MTRARARVADGSHLFFSAFSLILILCLSSASAHVKAMGKSGLQKQVLSLARALLRATRGKDSSLRKGVLSELRAGFTQRTGGLMLAEHNLRRGEKALLLIRDGRVTRWSTADSS